MRVLSAFVLGAVLLLCGSIAHAQIIYVDASAGGANNGTSWTDAYTDLQTALASASAGNQIWVAAGTYYPDAGVDRTATFQLITGVELYGGFAGGEVSLGDRDIAANVTTLSGDIGVAADDSDNTYHVVTGSGVDATAVFDGFTVTLGRAFGVGHTSGAGMLCLSGTPTVRNIIFYQNEAQISGGGMYISTLAPVLTNVTFEDGDAQTGGGLYNSSASTTLQNVLFYANSASVAGGGLYNFSGSFAIVTNCTFNGNTSQNGGGMANNQSSPEVTNTIIYGNQAGTANPSVQNIGVSMPTFLRCLIEGSGGSDAWSLASSIDLGFNIDRDPIFVDEDNADFRLQLVSPALNKGKNNATALPAIDFAGNPRNSGGRVDMGIFEYQFDCPAPTRIYVNATAAGTGDGTSWTDAMNELRDAMVIAKVCENVTEIWVQAGTYTPTPNDDIEHTFTMLDGLTLYGGFVGTETSPDQRTSVFQSNVSRLSGIIDGGAQVRHVMTTSGNDATAVIDGVTIQDGAGVHLTGTHDVGGGIYNIGGSPTLRMMRLRVNVNGMYNEGGSPTLHDVRFVDNMSTGFVNDVGGLATITECIFRDNSGSKGGGIRNSGSTISMSGSVFKDNHGSFGGSSVFMDTAAVLVASGCTFEFGNGSAVRAWYEDCELYIYDSVFFENVAGIGAAIESEGSAAIQLEQVVFDRNDPNVDSVVYLAGSKGTLASFKDCIFSGSNGSVIHSWEPITMVNCMFNGNTSISKSTIHIEGAPADFLNVTFGHNAASPASVVEFDENINLVNCISWGNTVGTQFVNNGVGTASFYNSDIEGSGGSGAWNGSFGVDGGGNIDDNPLWVSPPFIDMTVFPVSPVIDAGLNTGLLPIMDLIGQARIIGAEVDMGAYEYNPFTGIEDDDPPAMSYERRLSTFPNPFNPTLTVEFVLESAAAVEVTVFDLSGARVRTLVREQRPAGPHAVEWLSDDDAGQRVASGVYFVRLSAGDWRETRKVVLLK